MDEIWKKESRCAHKKNAHQWLDYMETDTYEDPNPSQLRLCHRDRRRRRRVPHTVTCIRPRRLQHGRKRHL